MPSAKNALNFSPDKHRLSHSSFTLPPAQFISSSSSSSSSLSVPEQLKKVQILKKGK